MKRLFRKIRSFFRKNPIENLHLGPKIEFINEGEIKSNGAYLGFVENNSVKIANKSARSYLKNTGEIIFGNNVRIHKGMGIIVEGKLEIGDNTFINPDTIIYCQNEITIGENCAISWNVTIMDTDLHKTSISKTTSKSVHIGNRVWIGAGVFIGKGVRIGDGSIVAAQSVVVKDIPDNCLFGGNPAQLIRNNVHWN